MSGLIVSAWLLTGDSVDASGKVALTTSGFMTTSSGMSSVAVEPTTRSMYMGEMPLPGPLVVIISRVMVVPLGIATADTTDFASLVKTGASLSMRFFSHEPSASSTTAMSRMSVSMPLGSSEAAWSPPFMVRSSVMWRSTTLAPIATAASEICRPFSWPE